MPRNWINAVPESNGSVPQQEEFWSDQPMLANAYRRFEEIFDRQLKGIKSHFDIFDELADEMRDTTQRCAGLDQHAR